MQSEAAEGLELILLHLAVAQVAAVQETVQTILQLEQLDKEIVAEAVFQHLAALEQAAVAEQERLVEMVLDQMAEQVAQELIHIHHGFQQLLQQ
jgi:hypothetical protein